MRAGRHAKGLVVLGATLAPIVGNGFDVLFTFGVFLKPVSGELGLLCGSMSLGLTFALLPAALRTSLAGWLVPNSRAASVPAYSLAGPFASGPAQPPRAQAISHRSRAGRIPGPVSQRQASGSRSRRRPPTPSSISARSEPMRSPDTGAAR